MQNKLTKILNKGLEKRAKLRGDKPFFHVEQEENGEISFYGTSVTGERVRYYVDDFYDVDQLVADIDFISLTCTDEDRVHMWLDAKEDGDKNIPDLYTLVKSAKDIYFHLSLLAIDINDMAYHELTVFDKTPVRTEESSTEENDAMVDSDRENRSENFLISLINTGLHNRAMRRLEKPLFHAEKESDGTIAFIGRSEAGEELYFSVDFSKDINALIDNVQALYHHFDVDGHVQELLKEQSHGRSYRLGVSALVDDARRIEQALKTLSNEITDMFTHELKDFFA